MDPNGVRTHLDLKLLGPKSLAFWFEGVIAGPHAAGHVQRIRELKIERRVASVLLLHGVYGVDVADARAGSGSTCEG